MFHGLYFCKPRSRLCKLQMALRVLFPELLVIYTQLGVEHFARGRCKDRNVCPWRKLRFVASIFQSRIRIKDHHNKLVKEKTNRQYIVQRGTSYNNYQILEGRLWNLIF